MRVRLDTAAILVEHAWRLFVACTQDCRFRIAATLRIDDDLTMDTDGQLLRYGDAGNGERLEGRLFLPRNLEKSTPAVLVFPEWWGVTAYACQRAQQLANCGYVALVADMYGEGKMTRDAQLAESWAHETRTGLLARHRAAQALEALRTIDGVDASRIAAIGFCFGGSVALELARSGAKLRAAVAFHAGLHTPIPAERGSLLARVLVLNGASDSFVDTAERLSFEEEMREAAADWQFIQFGPAKHSFSNPEADSYGMEGVEYDHLSAQRAWRYCENHLLESF